MTIFTILNITTLKCLNSLLLYSDMDCHKYFDIMPVETLFFVFSYKVSYRNNYMNYRRMTFTITFHINVPNYHTANSCISSVLSFSPGGQISVRCNFRQIMRKGQERRCNFRKITSKGQGWTISNVTRFFTTEFLNSLSSGL